MRVIIANQLWLGNARDARDTRRVVDAGVECLVDLALEETPPTLLREMPYLRFPLADGHNPDPRILVIAVETIVSLIERAIPTMVYCGAGMSRSPATLAIALSIAQRTNPVESLQSLISDQPHDVSPPLWDQLLRLHAERWADSV